jgi:hypothetical protein
VLDLCGAAGQPAFRGVDRGIIGFGLVEKQQRLRIAASSGIRPW